MEAEAIESNIPSKVEDKQENGKSEKFRHLLSEGQRFFATEESKQFWTAEHVEVVSEAIKSTWLIYESHGRKVDPLTYKDFHLVVDAESEVNVISGFHSRKREVGFVLPESKESAVLGNRIGNEALVCAAAHEATHYAISDSYVNFRDGFEDKGYKNPFQILEEAVVEMSMVKNLHQTAPDVKPNEFLTQYYNAAGVVNETCEFISESLREEFPTTEDAFGLFQELFFGKGDKNKVIDVFTRVYGGHHGIEGDVMDKIAELSDIPGGILDREILEDRKKAAMVSKLGQFMEGTRSRKGY